MSRRNTTEKQQCMTRNICLCGNEHMCLCGKDPVVVCWFVPTLVRAWFVDGVADLLEALRRPDDVLK